MVLSWAGQALGDLLFPPACVVCRRSGAPLCERCQGEFHFLAPPLCSKCGRPLAAGPGRLACGATACRDLHFLRARSVAEYEGAAREAVLALKFRRQLRVAEPLGRLMAQVASADALLSSARLVVPVPLHRSRLAERGFNQAELLARVVSSALGLPLRSALLRRIGEQAVPQSTLSAAARKANAAGAFVATETLDARPVLVVDDVLSTGATVSECGRVLRGAGAGEIMVLTAAAALLPPGASRPRLHAAG